MSGRAGCLSLLNRACGGSPARRVKITEDGLGAVIKLAQGDMRKCLNVLQVTGNTALSACASNRCLRSWLVRHGRRATWVSPR